MQPVRLLSEWFERVQRALPWRKTRDPYAIWISEVMLQQTQVATVLPYYERFLEHFPSLEALARSEEQEVLRHWSGLGYYSRAKNLRQGAQFLVDKYGGKFPRTREKILEVPGIGPYTAGAVLSIAFDLPEALVDGNVQRVLARYYAFSPLLESKEAKFFFWSKAQEWVERAESPRVFNQALMELGATVCTKAQPKCGTCPLAPGCLAFQQDRPQEFPKRKPRKAAKKLWWGSLVQEKEGRFLLTQNEKNTWWAGLWDFPRVEDSSTESVDKRIHRHIKAAKNLQLRKALPLQEHTVTHHRILVAPYLIHWKGKTPHSGNQRWVTFDEAQQLPLSSLARKILNSLRGI